MIDSARTSRFAAIVFASLLLALGAALAASPVQAQRLADGLSGFTQESSDPIEIEADELEVLDAQNLAIFRGSVRVVQGTATLLTRELRVHYEGNGETGSVGPTSNQRLRLLEAIGDVEIRSEDQYATGDQGRFDFITEQITLTGNVLLQQGENLVRGQTLLIDLTTRESRLEAAPAATGGGRVTGVFIPGSQPQQ
ncbi:MAG: lipopolysaccharide transport periplasmic protein LptA [Devosiaceae bacterium]|nr:lipopolysaccharide transport periplasmic protein LptA [Devosiaceae bacterium MH13]